MSYGAAAVAAGLPLWFPVALGIVVLAAGSEFLFLGIVAAGGSPATALLAGLLVNARHIGYGFSVADVLGTGWRRIRHAHLLNDETVAVALSQRATGHSRAAYLACGLGILAAWPSGTLLGGLLGNSVPDPGALGLDAVFPAVLLALIMPALSEPPVRRGAAAGAILALLTTPLLPPGLPILLAGAGAALTIPRRRHR
ncbi:branched-chain amino acid ABC transporter permease [Nocardia jinanensis]|uniref:Branched-chain amino acid ABC transporter permease n=2 Tax=Nocardia jinanensis TaxID=382504 RepID=A0A917RX95_9NOCA|nr:branched-chain amino acid ABC transporter permease [Nocardia jinanensis]